MLRLAIVVGAICCVLGQSSPPIVGFVQPWTASDDVRGVLSFGNPLQQANPFVVFGTQQSNGGLKIYTYDSLTTTGIAITAPDVHCGTNDCRPRLFTQYGDAICWTTAYTATCAALATGKALWSNALTRSFSSSGRQLGSAGPDMFWFQYAVESKGSVNAFVAYANGSTMASTAANSAIGNTLGVTQCNAQVCVSAAQNVTNMGTFNILVAYAIASPADTLWTIVLPTASNNVPTALAFGTANGRTIVVGLDGTCVFGADVITGTLLFNSSYQGTIFDPTASYSQGGTTLGVCGAVLVMFGMNNIHFVSITTGASVFQLAYPSNGNPAVLIDFLCTPSSIYISASSPASAYFFSMSGSAAVPSIALMNQMSFTGNPTPCGTDNINVAYICGYSLRGYSVLTSALQFESSIATSTSDQLVSSPFHIVGTQTHCFMGAGSSGIAQCFDVSLPSYSFLRNASFVVGVTGDTVVTGPTHGDGSCFLSADTLTLLRDTAIVAGDSSADGSQNSGSGSGSASPIFKAESFSPSVVTSASGTKFAIVVAVLTGDSSTLDCVRAFELATGKLAWFYCLQSTQVQWQPVTTPDNSKLLVIDTSNTLIALDVQSGKPSWKSPCTVPYSSSSISTQFAFNSLGTALYGASDYYFFCVSVDTGSLLWRHSRTSTNLLLQPVFDNGALYLCYTTSNGPLVCEQDDPATGDQRIFVIVMNPASTPVLTVYKNRFLINVQDDPANQLVGGLFQINWNEPKLSHTAISLPVKAGAQRDVTLLGILDDILVWRVRSTGSEIVEARKISDGAIVWSVIDHVVVGPDTDTILTNGFAASTDAKIVTISTGRFLIMVNWYTGARVRVIPRVAAQSPAMVYFTSYGNSTVLVKRTSTPAELDSYPNLLPVLVPPPSLIPTELPPTLKPAPTPVPTTAVPTTLVPPTTATPPTTRTPPTTPAPTNDFSGSGSGPGTPRPPPSPTPSQTPPGDGSNSFAGAATPDDSGPNPAGLGIGITFGVLAFVALIFFLVRRSIRQTMQAAHQHHADIMQAMTPMMHHHQQQEVVLVPTAHGYVPMVVSSPRGGHYNGDGDSGHYSGPAAMTNDKFDGADGHYGGKEDEEVDDGGPAYGGIEEDNSHVAVQRKERGKSVFGLKK